MLTLRGSLGHGRLRCAIIDLCSIVSLQCLLKLHETALWFDSSLEAAMERPIAAFAAFTGLTAALFFALKRRQAVSMSSAKLVAVFLIGSL